MLVGSNYKKIKQIQEKYKCNIKLTDDDDTQVKITIVGNEKSTVEMLEKKLNVKKRE